MTQKKDGSRFDDLFGAVSRSRADDTPPLPAQEKKRAKGSNPDYVRTTIYLPKQLHRQLKAAALDEEQEMSEIIEELIHQWLESRNLDV
jgi:ABC-type iron transport system FetAB ATPase subunit